MIDIVELAAVGYKPFPSDKGEYCPTGWQKCVRNANGSKLYFINFYVWYWPEHSGLRNTTSVSVDVRLYMSTEPKDSGGVECAPLLDSSWTIEDVETFYQHAYKMLGCVPDVHNN